MRHINTCILRAAAGASLLVASTPVVALAEEENTGMKLLLPNMAEFIPACIAFIIIWIILAKFAWPMVLKMMEERESKIQGDLDAAEQAKTKAESDAKAYSDRLAAAERDKKAMAELSGSVIDLSVEIASKLVGNDLTDDQHRRLAERYLQEVGAGDGSK